MPRKGAVADAVKPAASVSKTKLKKVAICGTADSLKSAPFEDADFDIWAVSPCVTYPWFKRCTVMFEMHDKDYYNNDTVIERLNRSDAETIYMQEAHARVPNSKAYPLEEIHAAHPSWRRNYTNSISYMLALAVHQEFHHMALFGVHMSADEEYWHQRASCEYWIAIADAIGIDVYIHPDSAICSVPDIYGYTPLNPVIKEIRERRKGLLNGVNLLNNELRAKQEQLWRNQGAATECEFWLKKYKAYDGLTVTGEKQDE